MKIKFDKEFLKCCGNCKKQENCTYPIPKYFDDGCNPKWKTRPKIHRITGATITKGKASIFLSEKELKQLQCGIINGELSTSNPIDSYCIF